MVSNIRDCNGYEIKTNTDIVIMKLREYGVNFHRGNFSSGHYKIQWKLVGVDGKTTLANAYNGSCDDVSWSLSGKTGCGIELLRPVAELAKSDKLEIEQDYIMKRWLLVS